MGYDLYALEGKIVSAHEQILIPTNISIALPKGMYAYIMPRSGLAVKHQINVHTGVIDANYRGNLGIILFNLPTMILSSLWVIELHNSLSRKSTTP